MTRQAAPRPRRLGLAAAIGLVIAQHAHGAGFALIEQDVSGMGTAYAGAAATADSLGTLYFNPAGMTRLPGTRAGGAVHLVLPSAEFRNEGSSFVVGGAPIPGGDGGDSGGLAAVPHAYLSHQLDDRTWLGLAINAPFGLTTEYDTDWVGRYHAIKSAVKTINLNPSIAFKANERLSLSAGLSAMYLEGEFTNAVDFGTLNALGQLGPLGGLVSAVPGQADGGSKIEGDSWGYGFNLGALFELDDDTRIGMHYRSEVEQEIKGDVRFTLPVPQLAAVFSDADVRADVTLPASFSLSGYHRLNSEWALMADYTWTGWSSIPELRFDFANALPDGVTTFDWKDTNRISVGASYKPAGSGWTYRLGAAYDESPIRDAASRTPRLPDDDRIWLAIGAGFSPSPRLTVDIGYAHLFIDDPRIAKTGTEAEDITRGALYGSYESSVDILSIQASYVF
jgi:long-chain fatty acid transport protein